jgi:DNA-binding FadR family transcriptional regulator
VLKDRLSSAVANVAERIREDVLLLDEGQLLGSEDTLLARYKVSRPTLRQAASLVAQEQLMVVRRGVGGGYFAKRPDSRAVSRMAALYLKVHDAKLIEIVSAFMPQRVEMARLATHCSDPVLRERLAGFLEREREIDENPHFRDFVTGERRFNQLLGQMAGNKALSLFLEILLDLAAMVDREEDMYRNRPDRVATLRQERNRLGLAILERDEEMAVLVARRCARMSSEWLLEDIERREKSERGGQGEPLATSDFNFGN